MPTTETFNWQGHRYHAKQNAGGTWDIFDVEVFAEHERFGKKIDRQWMERAIQKSKILRGEGYNYKLHVHHHGNADGKVPVLAGNYELTRIVNRPLEGTPTDVMLANLRNIPDEVYQEIKEGKLPHRSVELSLDSFDDPDIDSLALLSTESPFFKFPDLKPQEAARDEIVLAADAGPLIAYSTRQDRLTARFNWASDMEKKKKKPGEDGEGFMMVKEQQGTAGSGATQKEDMAQAPRQDGSGNGMDQQGPAAQAQNPQQEQQPPMAPNQQPPAEAAPEPMSPEVAKIEAIMKLGDALIQALGGLMESLTRETPSEATTPEGDETVQGGPVTMSDDTKAITPDNVPQGKGTIEYAARIAALEGKLALQEKQNELKAAYEEAIAELESFGINDEAKSELKRIADENGKDGIAAYVAAVKRYGTPDPNDNSVGDETTEDALSTEADIAEVASYAEQGPAAVKLARHYSVQYDNAPMSLQRAYTRENFIKAQMAMSVRQGEE